MANTLHGPFVKGASLATGSYGTGVGQSNTFTSGNANNDETQAGVALHSFNPHMIGAGFVLSGAVCTKDGVNANQLDIASGEAYLIQSDGTPTLCDIAADNTHTTTGNPSTTMYLDLNPDGSWSWGTSHSAVTNHLTICSVTTDASANIATVVDARPTLVTLLSSALGPVGLAKLYTDAGHITSDGAGNLNASSVSSNGTGSSTVVADVNGNVWQTKNNAQSQQWNIGVDSTGTWFVYDANHTQFPLKIAPVTGNAAFIGNIYGNIGGGPLQAINNGTSVTLSGTYQDVPGCSITIPTSGKYVVMGSVSAFNSGSGSCSLTLNVNGTRQSLSGLAGPTYIGTTGTFQGTYMVTQTWMVTVSASQIIKLQVAGTGTAAVADSTNGSGPTSQITAQYLHN